MPQLRSSPSPLQSLQSIAKKPGKKKKSNTPTKKSAVPPGDDAESRDVRQPSPGSETDDSSTGSAGFVDKELDSLETQKADITRKRQELDAAEARIREKAQLLKAYPARAVPRSLPTPSGSASSGSSALSNTAARTAPVVARDDGKRLRQDVRVVDDARETRLRRIHALFPASDASRSPRFGDDPGDRDVRGGGPKRVRFADQQDPDDADDDDEALVLAAPEGVTRMSYITQASKLLLFLTNSTLSPSSTLLPSSLSPQMTLVYSAALTDIRQRLHASLGAKQPTFAEFLFILHAVQQYTPSLFPKRADRGSLAVATLAAWHTQFSNELSDLMRLANGSQEFVDGYFPVFILRIRNADASTFDPVVVVRDLFADATVKLVSERQKEVMKLALSQGPSQQHQSGGKGSGGKGWGKGGKGKGGKGNSYPPPPGMPGQDWHDVYWMYARFPIDSSGRRIRSACFKCGGGSTPNSSNSHQARDCKAVDSVVQDWVRYMKPAQ